MPAGQEAVLIRNEDDFPVDLAELLQRGDSVGITSAAYRSTVTIMRPPNQTAYTAGDVVGSSSSAVLEFTNIGPYGAAILITSATIECDLTAVPTGMSGFLLTFFSSPPPSQLADNAVFDATVADRPYRIGKQLSIGFPALEVAGSHTLYDGVDGINRQVRLTSTSLWAYLSTVGGYTPAANAEVYSVQLHAVAV